jgi:hypothetical protein
MWFMKYCCCCIKSKHEARIVEEKRVLAEESAEQNRTLNGILRAYNVTYHGSDYIRGQLPQHYNNEDGHVAADQNEDPNMLVDAFGKRSDPYAAYGFGWVAYFNYLYVMTILFSVISVIMLGPMGMYASQMGLKGVATLPGPYVSMGNLGFSKSICSSDYINVD